MPSNATTLGAALLLALAGTPAPSATTPEAESIAASPNEVAREEERELERDEARKLRQLREEQDMRRRAAARRLEAEQARQLEFGRLRSTIMNLEQRESTLHHDVRSVQQQLGTLSRDPADHSSMMRRYELERQLGYSQNQLDYATRSREGAAMQLDALRFRY